MKKVLLLTFLICLFVMPGCSGGGGGSSSGGSGKPVDPPTPPPAIELTLEEKVKIAQAEALSKGCTIVDTNTNYSLLNGGENAYGNNLVSKQGDQAGAVYTVPGKLTIKCGDQILNFDFDNNTTQSDYTLDANKNPVGDINEFFKTDKDTETEVKNFVDEKVNAASLCRFSEFPAATGSIDDDNSEYLSVKVSGKDCGNPEWFVNGSSTPAATGIAFEASVANLAAGENDITVKVTNPAGPNSLYLKRTQGAAVNDPATAIKVSILPSEIHTTTPSVEGCADVTDPDGNTNIAREWYDNNVFKGSGINYTGPFVEGHRIKFRGIADGAVEDFVEVIVINNKATAVKASLTPADIYATTSEIRCSGVGTDADGDTNIVNKLYINGAPKGTNGVYTGTVNWKDIILCESTADDVVTDSVSTVVKPSPCTVQFTSCYPNICAVPASYNEGVNNINIDAIVEGADQVIPGVTGEVPAGVIVTPSTNRVNYSGIAATGTGGANLTLRKYTTTVSGSSCSGSADINIIGPPVGPPE